MLHVAELRKRYGQIVALNGVDLDIAPGEICGLLGPNGAGKTTFVSIVSGLRRADSGAVTIAGADVLDEPQRARMHLGLAPQDLGIYLTLTIEQNLAFVGELAGLRGKELRTRIEEVAEMLSLTEMLARPARATSGGEKRRLHTAMAMVHRPRLLLLDEPTAGVDVHTRARLLEAVRRLATDHGTAVCYSTHYLPEVETLGASVAIIDQGWIVARGPVSALIAEHADPAFELRFDGPPPKLETSNRSEIEADVLRVYDPDPPTAIAATIGLLGEDAGRLRGVEIIEPSLESVFLALTGRRYGRSEGLSEEEVEGHEPGA